MLKRTAIVLLLVAGAASAVAAGNLKTLSCFVGKAAVVAQDVTHSEPYQLAHRHEVAPLPAVDDERGRWYDERDLPFTPQSYE